MDEVKFGTSGLRGRVCDLTAELCAAYTIAFLRLMQESYGLKQGDCLLLGMDLRPSSPSVAGAVAGAAYQSGFNVENCGMLPTPALALAAFKRRLPAIMVTGSHIPSDRNGLKFYSPEGEINKRDELAIYQNLKKSLPITVDAVSLPLVSNAALEQFLKSGNRFSGKNCGKSKELEHLVRPSETKTALESYKARAGRILPPRALSAMKIGIYQQSCVARDFLGEILGGLGAQIVPFGRSQSFLAIDTEALSEETRNIAVEAARCHQLDAIVSTDGDGDRPLIAGSDGVYLRGDNIGLLCAQFLRADCIVTPVTSSSIIERSGLFKQVCRCRVGSPYVLAEMAQAKAQNFQRIVGFEANGGVLLGSDIRLEHGDMLPALATRDALLPILAVLGLAARQSALIEKLIDHLPSCFTASDRLENISAKAAADFLVRLSRDAQIRRDFCQNFGVIESQDEIDGLRLLLTKSESLHYRASGNAPELRCYSEASTLDKAESLLQKGLAFARQKILFVNKSN